MSGRVILKARGHKLLQKGYPWIFANQIARIEGTPHRGDVVDIYDAEGHFRGRGFYHDTSLIAIRFLTPEARPIDRAFFAERLERALALRKEAFLKTTHCRILFSESDGFPGTIVDHYGDVLTWTCISYGMEQRRDMVLDLLEEYLQPKAIVERNDTPLRIKDDLPVQRGLLRGKLPPSIEIQEEDVRFLVDVLEGPKTGFFLDQRFHRMFIRPFARGKRVLDVFTADGGFGLHAAAAGAEEVTLLDVSPHALSRARTNATHNHLEARIRLVEADAMEQLVRWSKEGMQFDLIILDPPSFAKSRRHREQAIRAYQLININALNMLAPGGYLATASCSQAIDEETFYKILLYSTRKAGAHTRLLYRGFQPPDHPVLPSMPETYYLKFYFLQRMYDELPARR